MSQITIGDKTLNFKDSVYTGDQWEQVASWVLNGGGTLIDENVEIVTQKASETLQAAQNAVASAQAADGSADLSQSYAVGGTGTRNGENTDNAKYYSEQAGKVVNALNNAHINENGHLVYTSPSGSTVDLGEVVGSSIESIERTSGTGAPGTTDTYTVTLTNGNTTTFQVYNGKDGSGAGDMTKSVYDPQNKAQDIFAYADAKQAKITASGILKGNGAGGVSAAVKGTDYAGASETVTATLLAARWTGGAAPYSYTLTVSGVTATSNQEVLPALNITVEQLESLQSANIQDGGQAANSMTLKAYGDKPAIDLPIRVIKRGD